MRGELGYDENLRGWSEVRVLWEVVSSCIEAAGQTMDIGLIHRTQDRYEIDMRLDLSGAVRKKYLGSIHVGCSQYRCM
jgi:hypothetical protein